MNTHQPIATKIKRKTSMAYLLTALSGYVDALGLMMIGGVFLSFMSGNTTRIALHMMNHEYFWALQYLAIISGFVFGAFIGNLLAHFWKHEILIMIFTGELILFLLTLVFMIFQLGWIAYIPLAIAMGYQNTAQINVCDVIVGKSFMTGQLYALGIACSHLVLGKGSKRQIFILLSSWCTFVFGACLGAYTDIHFTPTQSILILLGITCLLLCSMLVIEFRTKTAKSSAYQSIQ